MTDHSNPAAFPVSTQWQAEPQLGMSLRDWFAGVAIGGMLADPNVRAAEDDAPWAPHASVAYAIADAMLIARQKVSS